MSIIGLQRIMENLCMLLPMQWTLRTVVIWCSIPTIFFCSPFQLYGLKICSWRQSTFWPNINRKSNYQPYRPNPATYWRGFIQKYETMKKRQCALDAERVVLGMGLWADIFSVNRAHPYSMDPGTSLLCGPWYGDPWIIRLYPSSQFEIQHRERKRFCWRVRVNLFMSSTSCFGRRRGWQSSSTRFSSWSLLQFWQSSQIVDFGSLMARAAVCRMLC